MRTFCFGRRCPCTFRPAFSLCASGVKLLGRCLNGSDGLGSVRRDLTTGFNWLATQVIDDTGEDTVVIETSSQRYTVGSLVQLRNFAAHGQATVRGVQPTFDPELLNDLPELMRDGLENYWFQLNNDDDFCEALGRANVLAIRSWPILQTWYLFQGDGSGESITTVFSQFDWRAIGGSE